MGSMPPLRPEPAGCRSFDGVTRATRDGWILVRYCADGMLAPLMTFAHTATKRAARSY
jgi:hypothetical protein